MYRQTERLKYIQNRRHWCWAVACKMVGEQYKRLHTGYDFNIIGNSSDRYGNVTAYEYENGVVTDNLDEINWKLQWTYEIRVDAWQRAIVMNANTAKYPGYDGDVGGDDEAKVRGIKYYLTGDIYSDRIKVETLGLYDEPVSLLDRYRKQLMDSVSRHEYIIGNAMLHEKKECHSFVILYIEGEKVMLYNTSDGEILYCRAKEAFDCGFKSGLGTGTIKWVQRIV
ncbi:MAG: hypothetical protein K2L82_13135 [Lachnospiraceae bacterium]|nr:hypothetical protein [Lachnospiraceae bacterium]